MVALRDPAKNGITIRIGDNLDPALNSECATALSGGAYSCNLQGKYVSFVGKAPTDKWKFSEIIILDSFIPDTTVTSSPTVSGFEAKKSA